MSFKTLYVHPITMNTVYINDQPTREPELALSPSPDTIGPFDGTTAVINWIKSNNLIIVRYPLQPKGTPNDNRKN